MGPMNGVWSGASYASSGRPTRAQVAEQQTPPTKSQKTIVTTTRTTTSTTEEVSRRNSASEDKRRELDEVAIVEDQGKQGVWSGGLGVSGGGGGGEQAVGRAGPQPESRLLQPVAGIEGNRFVTTIGTIAAQSSQTRVVLALLKDGERFQLKVQEMRPSIFEVGANLRESQKFLDEHRRVMENLDKQRQAPLECWMDKYKKITDQHELKTKHEMSNEMKLVFMCMAENLQGCWRALWWQLEQRMNLLKEASEFYQICENLSRSIEQAEKHVESYRKVFLDGPNSSGLHFQQAANELKRLNYAILREYSLAKQKQKQFVDLIGKLAMANLADMRQNHLVPDAQNLINFILAYLDPLELRKIQLENVMKTTTISTTSTTTNTTNRNTSMLEQTREPRQLSRSEKSSVLLQNGDQKASMRTPLIREISNFNDLNLVDNWLRIKIDQLNSSLLSSLGTGQQDTRSILNKHEQIALECSAIEEATLNFNGKNIHALKAAPQQQQQQQQQQQLKSETGSANAKEEAEKNSSLFEQQKVLATRARDVITILDARLSLLRRTIDFYYRAKEATSDISKWSRRLQVDNSLQSVQFVANELEQKDVSAVVASGATILSELQQLQLAQQHGQRSKIVNLNLVTSGIRSVIDQLNQDLAHLKTTLNQRRLVLLNEDASKMASNFSNKCHQLQTWLNNNVKSYLMSNNRIGFDLSSINSFINGHEEVRLALQNKTPEVEALLRLLSTMSESLDAKSEIAEEIQRDTDELRQDWINITNCLDRRVDLARKFLAILTLSTNVGRDLDCLQQATKPGSQARPRTPDERTDDDIRAQVEQALLQLDNQVNNFTEDAQKTDTSLVYAPALETKAPVNDINKQQVVGHANGALRLLNERHRATVTKLSNLGRGPLPGPLQRVGPWSPTFRQQESVGEQRQQQQPKVIVTRDTQQQKRSGPPSRSNGEKLQTTANEKHSESGSRIDVKPAETQPALGPSFLRSLEDKVVEPFSTVQLECETDPKSSAGCRIEWLLNNNKRIPSIIKHSILNDGHKHKLVISQFNPTCCGTYTARATDPDSGRSATTSCRLQLAGIKEVADFSDSGESWASHEEGRMQRAPQNSASRKTTTTTTTTSTTKTATTDSQARQLRSAARSAAASSPATSSTSSFTQWSSAPQQRALNRQAQQQQLQQQGSAIERIIQGVESPASFDEQTPERVLAPSYSKPSEQQARLNPSEATTTKTTITTTSTSSGGEQQLGSQFPVVQTVYNGSNYGAQNWLSAPSGTEQIRSVSRSPFEGTPVPPIFVQNLADSTQGRCSGAGLVCVVVGNPPPTIEWLHNNQPIAHVKCPKPEPKQEGPDSKAHICKLTIQTMSDKTRGQYVCRATNRLGQTSTALTLNK